MNFILIAASENITTIALDRLGVMNAINHEMHHELQAAFDDPLNRELNLVSVLPQPLYGIVEQPGAFWHFGDVPIVFKRCCPDIGEHSDEILREIGYSNSEITSFREQKVVG